MTAATLRQLKSGNRKKTISASRFLPDYLFPKQMRSNTPRCRLSRTMNDRPSTHQRDPTLDHHPPAPPPPNARVIFLSHIENQIDASDATLDRLSAAGKCSALVRVCVRLRVCVGVGGSGRIFGGSPLLKWADFDAVLWDTDKPQPKQTAPDILQMCTTKFELLTTTESTGSSGHVLKKLHNFGA